MAIQNNSIFNKLHFKLRALSEKARILYFRLNGMTLGKNIRLGRIDVECPNSISMGDNCNIGSGCIFWIQNPYDPANRITLGNNVYIGKNVEFNCCYSISVGDNCLIASSTVFVDSSHTFSLTEIIRLQPVVTKKIKIEEDVWIGLNCKILNGVQLGRGCIIGAGSVVNRSVPAYEIWAGVPARKIGERR